MRSPTPPPSSSRAAAWARGAILVLLVLVIYWPAVRGGWLWDDQKEILRNPELVDLGSLGRAWVDPQNTTYYPLTTTLLWLELRLWGDDPTGYHLVSIALHACSALLVWRLLGRLGLRLAWWGALLFAIHPLAVESVAWIAELKNTASLPLLLLSFLSYLDFEESGRRRSYAIAVLCFVLAMLCKTAVAMTPFVLLLHAWWKHGALGRREIVRTLPFFATALLLGCITLWFEHHRAIGVWEIPAVETWQRALLAGRALAFYLGKLFAPFDLMPVYPQWQVSSLAWYHALPWLALVAVAAWCWRSRRTTVRGAGFALGFIVLNLVLVLGFIPIAFMRYSWVADHLAYLALVGVAGAAATGAQAIGARLSASYVRFAWLPAAAACLGLAYIAQSHARNFAGAERFWNFALRKNPEAWVAHANLAQGRVAASDLSGAIGHYRAALRVAPHIDSLRFNLGTALLHAGRAEEALAEFAATVRLKPEAADAAINAAAAELQLGRVAAARARLEAVLDRQPDALDARLMLGESFAAEDRLDDALREFSRAVGQRPDSIPARLQLANTRYALGDVQEAKRLYEAVLAAQPEHVEALANLGAIQLGSGDIAGAIRRFEAAARLEPTNVSVLINFATALAAQGRFREALAQAEAALRIDPRSAPARELRAQLLQEPALRR